MSRIAGREQPAPQNPAAPDRVPPPFVLVLVLVLVIVLMPLLPPDAGERE